MKANKNGRLTTGRITRTFHLAPTTRAIRAALAISMTMLVLGGSTVALADTGTCTTNTTTNTVTCDGDFTNLPGSNFTPVADLTLILGDTAPTSVTPASGIVGVEASWGGTVGVTSNADITTAGADGIHEYGSTSTTLTNNGSITTNVTAPSAEAVDISSYGNVTVVNNGTIKAYSTGASDVTALSAYSSHGSDVFVFNTATGTISATSQDGNAIGVNASSASTSSTGFAYVYNAGTITASSVNGIAIGVVDQSDTVEAMVYNHGSITATSTNGQAVGVAVSSAGGKAVVYSTSSYTGSVPSISASSGQDAAVGIEAYGQTGAFVTITKGSVTATSNGGTATGILAESNYGNASIINAGSIQATTLSYSPATGVQADSRVGDVYVGNTGSISANAGNGSATAILAQSQYGRTKVVNSGSLTAVATGAGTYYQHNQAIDIVASSGGGYGAGITSVSNSGTITATGSSLGEGIEASAWNGEVTVANTATGSIKAYGQDEAIGIGTGQNSHNGFGRYIDEHTYNAAIDNAGSITAVASGANCGSCYTHATGIQVFLNYGNDVSVNNTGNIAVTALGTARNDYDNALGIDAVTYRGDIVVDNAGTISVVNDNTASNPAHAHSYTVGILTSTDFGNNSVTNSGDINVSSSGAGGYSMGIWESVYRTKANEDISVVNSGNINVSAAGTSDVARRFSTFGIFAGSNCNCGWQGSLAVINAGDIAVSVLATNERATRVEGIYAVGVYNAQADLTDKVDSITVDNSGSIDIAATNTDDGPTIAAGHFMLTYGIHAYNILGSITINNTGNIASVIAAGTDYFVRSSGISASSFGGISIDNSGSISESVTGDSPLGVYGISANIGDNRNGENFSIVNSGDITINSLSSQGGGTAYGIRGSVRGDNSAGGDVTVNNSGNITIQSNANDAFGIHVQSDAVNVGVTNSGEVAISSSLFATGLYSSYSGRNTLYPGNVTLNNSGSVEATVNHGNSELALVKGVYVRTSYGDITMNNAGSIAAAATVDTRGSSTYGFGLAYGVELSNQDGLDGSLNFTNAGSITATIASDLGNIELISKGIQIRRGEQTGGPSSIAVDHSGTISATASISATGYGSAVASGISLYNTSTGTFNVTNSGSIAATATNAGSLVAAHIPYSDVMSGTATATGILVYGYGVTVALEAGGYVGATANGALGTATGLSMTNTNTTALATTNAGTICATFNGAGGKAYGAEITSAGDLSFTNSGKIFAIATDNAIGVTLIDPTASTLVNSGSIVAASTAAGTDATATAISLVNAAAGGSISLTNSGGVLATAATTGTGIATATGILVSAPSVAFTLGIGSYVGAAATGSSGAATALSLNDANSTALAISNPGTIKATFTGAGGKAYGADITSGGDLTFTNAGKIFATNGGDAVGLLLSTPGNITVVNSGLISGVSSAGNSIAVQTGASNGTFQNTGIINGAIVAGAGNDTVTNSVGGVWDALGSSTFGKGNDTITNAGTIDMDNSVISLGSFATLPSTITNIGMITAVGSNSIDMGANNPNPLFTNTGTIAFNNGSPGNSLTLTGNWAGSGAIGVAVDPLKGSSDMLHVVGNVAAGSVTSVNVDLLDLPTTATSSVPVVTVTGDSTAGNFVLGDVRFDTAKSFLVVQAVSLTSAIDTSNATPDVFSVGVGVTGVTDSGALAASIVPGIESLMNSEVGTWRQRMGVLTPTAQGSVGLWTRAFDDSGTVNPGHIAGNFGQGGNFSFDQTNSGEEIGADFAISQNFSAGLMLGNAQSNQHLDGSGVGRNRISGDTRGAYATWMTAGGFYLDASYRSMSFDARLDSQAGESRTTGNADAFNVELGQPWAFGDGFKLVPQLQYTKTTVNKADTLTGALSGFTPEGGDSSRGRAGLLLSKDIASSGSTVWTPYVSASAVHEFDGENNFTIDNVFSGATDTKGTSALVEGGISVKTGKLEVFGGVNWQDGGALKSFAGGQVGLHYNW